MRNYLQLLRISHYIKNLLLFFPIVFDGQLLNPKCLLTALMGFISFSAVSSIVYIINDFHDVEVDRQHPQKKNRPIASGAVTKANAVIVIIILSVIALGAAFVLGKEQYGSHLYLLIYLCINIAYTFILKDIPLIDIVVLGTGYLLRLLYGGEIVGIEISNWMFLTVLVTAFFLGFGKRKNEILQYGESGRKVLEKYTKAFLDRGEQLFLSLIIVFYSLCCADEKTSVAKSGVNLLWTVPIVILVLLRYDMILESGKSDGDPVEVLKKDIILQILIASYGISVLVLLYGHGSF